METVKNKKKKYKIFFDNGEVKELIANSAEYVVVENSDITLLVYKDEKEEIIATFNMLHIIGDEVVCALNDKDI